MSTNPASVFLGLALILFGCRHTLTLTGDIERAEEVMKNPESMPKAWLVGEVDFHETEEFCTGGSINQPIPAGIPNFRDQWLIIKKIFKPGDEIWLWSSNSQSEPFSKRGHKWANGYCLNRKGKIIYAFIIGKAQVN